MLLFTVVPLWAARALSRPAPPLVREPAKLPPGLPLAVGWLAVCLPVDDVPAWPGRGVDALNAPPLGAVLPAWPGRERLGCLDADVPGCPCGAV